MILYSFLFFLVCFTLIGVASYFFRQKTTGDYLLAGSQMKPWMAALSAVATNNSGYMFIGLIGFTYMVGLSSIWIMAGFIVGDFIISFQVHKKLREVTTAQDCISYSDLLAKWFGTDYRVLKIMASLLILIFLSTYAAAQLQAGGKALQVLFEWPYETGAIIGAVIVLLYCFAGGIRASIWTDVAQSFVMFFAMLMMFYITLDTVGGWDAFATELNNVSPTYTSLFPDTMIIEGVSGLMLFILGWLGAGIGVIGQPQIMVRFMTVDDPNYMTRVRSYYYGFYVIFTALTIITGLAARLLIPEIEAFDPELALPLLALELLPEILVGVVLAGLFAATMSTADSQILCCTAAVGQDLGIKKFQSYIANKIITVLITAFALGIVLVGSSNVFALVVMAWSMLASAFAPLMISYSIGWRFSQKAAIAIMVFGFAIALGLRLYGFNAYMFEATPAMVAAFILAFFLRQKKQALDVKA